MFLKDIKLTKTVLITGGCGYIGSHIARAFKFHDHTTQVIVIDRVKREHTLKDVDVFVEADFADEIGIQTLIKYNPGVIVHCAGTSLVGPSMADPAEYYDNNVIKTILMLNIIKQFKTKPVILFSSSASVYGEPRSIPITEDHELQPISPYGNTKLAIERILADYDRAYKIPSVCFRYFNAAGAMPGTADLGQESGATHIIARALEASIAGRAFTLYGSDYPTPDGTCIRDYVHVWDLAKAHVDSVDYMVKNPGAYVFNLGTKQGTSNQQIVDYIAERYGFKTVDREPRRSGDPAELVADPTKATLAIGWNPGYSDIGTIIDTAYTWYSKQNMLP